MFGETDVAILVSARDLRRLAGEFFVNGLVFFSGADFQRIGIRNAYYID